MDGDSIGVPVRGGPDEAARGQSKVVRGRRYARRRPRIATKVSRGNDAPRRLASRDTAAGGTTLWEMTTDPVPPSMFAGYHYTVDPKRPGYDGLWGTHPEFGLMRGTENIIGTVVRSPRFD